MLYENVKILYPGFKKSFQVNFIPLYLRFARLRSAFPLFCYHVLCIFIIFIIIFWQIDCSSYIGICSVPNHHMYQCLLSIKIWTLNQNTQQLAPSSSSISPVCARPTKHISIEFEIRWKFITLWCKIYAADHNDILHTSRQCHCRDVCKISLWSVEYIRN